MVMTKEKYRKYLEKVERLYTQTKRRPIKNMQGLSDYFSHYAFMAELLEFKQVSKTHILGLYGALGNLKKSESGLGLFSDGFDIVADKIAYGILTLTIKEPPLATQQLLKWWVELIVIGLAGALELARRMSLTKVKEGKYDPSFRDELLLTLLFSTEFPKTCFQKMGDALLIEKTKMAAFIATLETLSILVALRSYSKEGFKKELVESLSARLTKNLGVILSACDSLDSADQDAFQTLRTYFEQMQLALERGDIDGLVQIEGDLLESCGYSKENFQNDLEMMKSLFLRFKEAYYASKENKSTTVHMVG